MPSLYMSTISTGAMNIRKTRCIILESIIVSSHIGVARFFGERSVPLVGTEPPIEGGSEVYLRRLRQRATTATSNINKVNNSIHVTIFQLSKRIGFALYVLCSAIARLCRKQAGRGFFAGAFENTLYNIQQEQKRQSNYFSIKKILK